nr:MAG TPA: hypothetical protein [Bacteriophage sp.]
MAFFPPSEFLLSQVPIFFIVKTIISTYNN